MQPRGAQSSRLVLRLPRLAIAWLVVSAGAGDETLAGYRSSIDDIDASLVRLLGERFKITKQVGAYKASVGLPAADPEREAEQIVRLRVVAASVDLDPSFIDKFLRLVFAEVRREHELARRDNAPDGPEAERRGSGS